MSYSDSHIFSRRTSLIFGAVSVAALLSGFNSRADVLYRETFGNASSPVVRVNPNLFGWQVFNQTGAALTTVGGNYAVDTTAGFPANLANVNAGLNSDGSSGAVSPGPFFWAATQAGRHSYTPEYSFNISDYSSLSFSWYQGNANTVDPFRVALHVGGIWYVSTTGFTNSVSGISGASFGSLAGPNAQLMTYNFDGTAANWEILNFDGTYNGGGTFGGPAAAITASTLGGMFLTATNTSNLTGTVDAFGYMYWNPATVLGNASANAGGNVRIDNYQIDGVPINAPEPTSFALLGLAGISALIVRRRRN
jgi:hypothetical protein